MPDKKTILVTGFEPFGGQRINPSWVCADMLPDELEGCKIIKHELPVEWFCAIDSLYAAIEQHSPDAVLCIGQAADVGELNIERVGVNLCNGSDNAGCELEDMPVLADGPAAYFSTLPYKRMLGALSAAGVAAKYSFSAGTYLCNYVLYGALHRAACSGSGMAAGFLHVPMLPQQVVDTGGKCMPLEKMYAGVEICVREICASL